MGTVEQKNETADPLVDEVRQVRKAISDRCEDDFQKLGEYLRKVGDEHRERLRRMENPPADQGDADAE